MQLDVKRNRNKVTPSDVKYALTSELLSTNEKNSLSISGQTMLAREKYRCVPPWKTTKIHVWKLRRIKTSVQCNSKI